MDLYKIIPKNDRWLISKNIVYINYLANIPILTKNDDDIFVYLDARIDKYVIHLVGILVKNNIDFLFKNNLIFFDHKFSEEEIHRMNLTQYIVNICSDKFFDGFEKIEFDFTKNLTQYLVKYECYDIFKEVYEKEKKRILSKTYDYYCNMKIFNTKREEIRNYISSLEREVKIGLLFQ